MWRGGKDCLPGGENGRRNSFLPFDPLLRLHTAEFGMQRIYPGDLGRVTKGGVVRQRCAALAPTPSPLHQTPRKGGLSVFKFHRAECSVGASSRKHQQAQQPETPLVPVRASKEEKYQNKNSISGPECWKMTGTLQGLRFESDGWETAHAQDGALILCTLMFPLHYLRKEIFFSSLPSSIMRTTT